MPPASDFSLLFSKEKLPGWSFRFLSNSTHLLIEYIFPIFSKLWAPVSSEVFQKFSLEHLFLVAESQAKNFS